MLNRQITCEVRVGKFRVEEYLGTEEPLIPDIHSESTLCDAVYPLVLLDIFIGVLIKPEKKNRQDYRVTMSTC